MRKSYVASLNDRYADNVNAYVFYSNIWPRKHVKDNIKKTERPQKKTIFKVMYAVFVVCWFMYMRFNGTKSGIRNKQSQRKIKNKKRKTLAWHIIKIYTYGK